MGTSECRLGGEGLHLNVRQQGTFHFRNLLPRTHGQVLFPFRIDGDFLPPFFKFILFPRQLYFLETIYIACNFLI